MSVRRALISVSDKTGVVDLAKGLVEAGVEIISTGGTARALRDAGVELRLVSDVTGFPEILDGRVKTLHPAIHGGILARRGDASHDAALGEHGISPIDMVVVNLYPFRETVADPSVTLPEALEQIDIGGPCMIRAAAKNFSGVVVLTNPDQYATVLAELRESGSVSAGSRRRFAVEAFAHTAEYDAAIHNYLAAERGFPELYVRAYRKESDLRYGENPHQKAAMYVDASRDAARTSGGVLGGRRVAGGELSFNNLLDLEAAHAAVRGFEGPAVVVIKHNNPCGACEDNELEEAAAGAFRGDPEAAFGGIVGANRTIDVATAREMTKKGRFLEAVVAPGFEPEALRILTERSGWGERLRIVEVEAADPPRWQARSLEGGMLLQETDRQLVDESKTRTVSRTAPDDDTLASLRFAMRVCMRVKSNAIVLARGREVVGVGAGQMSRVESVRIALRKAGDRAKGAVLASDAFFPFRDSVDTIAAAGITGIIEPGGSKRDAEVITAADEAGIPLVFTGIRHFLH